MFQTDLSSFYRNNLANAYWGQVPFGVSQIPYGWNQVPGGASLLGSQIPYHSGIQSYTPGFTNPTAGYAQGCSVPGFTQGCNIPGFMGANLGYTQGLNAMCYPQVLGQFPTIPVGQNLIPTFGTSIPFNNQFLGQALTSPSFVNQGLTPFTAFNPLMNCR